MDNEKLVAWGVRIALLMLTLGLVFWLVDGNFWLKFFLAVALTASATAATEIREIQTKTQELMTVFTISDNQVVYISNQLERFVEKEDDWDEVSDLKSRIDELENQLETLRCR